LRRRDKDAGRASFAEKGKLIVLIWVPRLISTTCINGRRDWQVLCP
jgi:hypothetical protein